MIIKENEVKTTLTTNNPVSHPSHYVDGRKYEPIQVINDWQLGFNLGNAVKYISRAGRKDPSKYVEDLEKAIYYIQYEIQKANEVQLL
jgi:hypothetical protein